MISAESAVYMLYHVHSTHRYWPSAVYSCCDQFVLDPLYQQPKAEFVLDPLYQQPKRQFQPEAPLRKITK